MRHIGKTIQIIVIAVLWLACVESYAQERIALVIQAQGQLDFIETLYSGAVHAGSIHDYEISVHRLSLTESRPKKWLEEILKTQPKAIVIVDTPISPYTQDLLDGALRKNVMTGVVNADITREYFGAAFRIGSGKIAEGEAAGAYLKKQNSQAVLCINYIDGLTDNAARCQGLANGWEQRIYRINSDGNLAGIRRGVADFLQVFSHGGHVIVTDAGLLDALVRVRKQQNQQYGHDFAIGFVGTGGHRLAGAVLSGDVAFMVTDQPWLQGHWAVSAVALRDIFKLEPQELAAAGPALIDAQLAKRIQEGQKILPLPDDDPRKNRPARRSAAPVVPPLRLKK